MPRKRIERREMPAAEIPEPVRAWFAGERDEPLQSLASGEEETMLAYWRAWKKDHPRAVPPKALGPWRKLI